MTEAYNTGRRIRRYTWLLCGSRALVLNVNNARELLVLPFRLIEQSTHPALSSPPCVWQIRPLNRIRSLIPREALPASLGFLRELTSMPHVPIGCTKNVLQASNLQENEPRWSLPAARIQDTESTGNMWSGRRIMWVPLAWQFFNLLFLSLPPPLQITPLFLQLQRAFQFICFIFLLDQPLFSGCSFSLSFQRLPLLSPRVLP